MTHVAGGRGWLGVAGVGAVVVGLGLAGVVMAHYPMIRSGMGVIQTDLGDPRLINYCLEHTYLWVRQAPPHRDLWSPPFFYPASNVGAYSDLLLTVAPPYWALRGVGLEPDSAFQGWMMAISVLNYLALLALLRWGYRFAWPGCAAGAFLMAFAAPRINLLVHQQLMPAFFVATTLFALARLGDEPRPSRRRRWVWWQVAVGGLVAQLYAAFYIGWLLILALGVATLWGLALPGPRGRVLEVLRRDALPMAAAVAAGGLALVPFLTHYLAAAREFGARDYHLVRLFLPLPWSWLDVGAGHWLAGWTAEAKVFGPNDIPRGERHLGLGLVTPIVCAVGWWLGRNRLLVRVAAPVALTLILAGTALPGDAIATLGLSVSVLIAARLDQDRSRPGLRVLVLILLGAGATSVPAPTWREVSLTVVLLILTLLEAGRARREPARLLGAAVLILWLSFRLFDPRLMGFALGGAAIVAVGVAILEALLRPADPVLIRLGGIAVALALAGGLAYPDRPEVWGSALLTPVALVLGRSRAWDRVSSGSLVVALIVALAAVILLEGRDSIWYLVFNYVPGGTAVRAVGRIALAVLVPAAIGAAAFFGSPWATRRPIRAGLIGLVCLLEQGVTTPSYDKLAERARIANLARQIDPSARAFYYRPSDTNSPLYHIDAMMMSLRAGVPTVNGYSGGNPRAWSPLLVVDFYPLMNPIPPDARTAREALGEWLKSHHMPLDQVQAIGVNLDQRFPSPPPLSPTQGPPPG